MKIISVVGARPNFMKVAPLHRVFVEKYSGVVEHLICHTGQHYDEKMSKVFFDELELPHPHFYLGIGGGSHAEQTGRIMIEFEKVLLSEKPDLVIVVGDVNSTIACSLTAVKLGIKVAHVEAGLRSNDRSMPEEINRILTDSISDYLFVTEKSGLENLSNEGVSSEKVFFVGHVMIDSLHYYLPKSEKTGVLSRFGLVKQEYILVTLHRPSNVDDEDNLRQLIQLVSQASNGYKVLFPVHPRTRSTMQKYEIVPENSNIILTDPIGYLDFIGLMKNSRFILTDSGGIQEESTFMGVPCVTLRNTTERPVTVEVGTNYLVGEDISMAHEYISLILEGRQKTGGIPELWDGHASERIAQIIVKKFEETEVT